MPLQLPDLASKTYSDIMDEMLVSIPKYSDTWTNFNPSDPGITLLELFSWIADMTLYRINRVPEDSYINFLELVAGTSKPEHVNLALENLKSDPAADRTKIKLLEFLREIEEGKQKEIPEIRAAALKFLTSSYRAITEDDFERLAIEATENDIIKVKRAVVIGKPEKVEIIVISDPIYRKNNEIYSGLLKKVKEYLSPRRLIGTRIEVKVPAYTNIKIDLRVTIQYQYDAKDVIKEINDRILEYLHPLTGGHDKKGWPYNRRLTIYDLDRIVEEIDGVDYVNEIKMTEIDKDVDCVSEKRVSGSKESIEIKGLVHIENVCLFIEEAR